jgi:hypothetical protein
MFTKQDYKAIAEIIEIDVDPACLGSEDPCAGCAVAQAIAWRLADYFAEDNSRFDRKRFLEACRL